MSLVRLAPAAAVAATLAALCGGCGPVLKVPTLDEDPGDGTCKAKDPLNPLIVEWPATSKVQLDSVSQRGVVVVAFDGCNLKVLNGCDAAGSYAFQSVTPAVERLEIGDQNDLGAMLPLGAVSLGAGLTEGRKLVLDYVAVGERRTDKPPSEMSGMCEGATHYVRTITLGAYSIDAMAKGTAGVQAEVSEIGGHAYHSENQQHMRGSGDVQGCSQGAAMGIDDAKQNGCAAVIQLGLAPIGGSTPAKP